MIILRNYFHLYTQVSYVEWDITIITRHKCKITLLNYNKVCVSELFTVLLSLNYIFTIIGIFFHFQYYT